MEQPAVPKIVLVGGGHGHVQVLRGLRPLCQKGEVSIVVIDKNRHAMYSGMMPGAVAGLYEEEECFIHIPPLAKWTGAIFVEGKVVAIDTQNKEVSLSDGRTISYDKVSFDIGSATLGTSKDEKLLKYSVATRPINLLLRRLIEAETTMIGNSSKEKTAVVVGGGAAGCELALALRGRWAGKFPEETIHMSLVHRGARVLDSEPKRATALVEKELENKRIRVLTERAVASVDQGTVTLDDGSVIPCDIVVWATGAEPHPMRHCSACGSSEGGKKEGGACLFDDAGYLTVNSFLQSTVDNSVFGVGDCISMAGKRIPKAGVYAVREGPILAENLEALVRGESMAAYQPQHDFLKLLMCGDGTAIGMKFGIGFRGKWVWKLKDYIDKSFMRLFQNIDEEGSKVEEENGKLQQYDSSIVAESVDEMTPEGAADALSAGGGEDDSGNFSTQHAVLKRMAEDATFREAVCRLYIEKLGKAAQ